MCDPTTIFLAASVASAGVAAYSSIQQGKAAERAAEYNAKVDQINAAEAIRQQDTVREQAAIDRRRLAAEMRGARGQAVASAAAMGLDPNFGSSADLVGDIEQGYRIDKSIINRNEQESIRALDMQAAGFKNQATLSIMEGKAAKQAGYLGAAGSLLQGASAISSRFITPPKPKGGIGSTAGSGTIRTG